LGAALEYFRDLSEEQVSGVDITNGGSGGLDLSALRWHDPKHGWLSPISSIWKRILLQQQRRKLDAHTHAAARPVPDREKAKERSECEHQKEALQRLVTRMHERRKAGAGPGREP
jgi:hypothetical protein